LPADDEEEEEEEQEGRAYQSTLITAEDFDGDGMLAYPPPSTFVGSARPPVYGYDFSFPDDDDDDDGVEGFHAKAEDQREDNIDGDQDEEDAHVGQGSTAPVRVQKNFEVSSNNSRRKS
jgi:hypothetical protein